MPTVPIYIRVEDLDKWKALENKSEFVHQALNNGVLSDERYPHIEMKPVETEVEVKNWEGPIPRRKGKL